MSLSFKHILGVAGLVMVVVILSKPDLIRYVANTKFVEASHATVQSLGELVPTPFLSYLDPMLVPAPRKDNRILSTEAIIDATNAERIKEGLSPLRSNPELIKSAMQKTNDMIAREYFEHASPDGRQVWDLATEAGYAYVIIGENLARGNFVDAEDLLDEWMKSPGHRANILTSKYQEVGTYAARGLYEGHEVWFAVQHFGTPIDACPTINAKLKSSVYAMDQDLTRRRAQIANEKAALVADTQPEGEEYKERINAFNVLVAEYNTILMIYQQNAKNYNAQVAAFNNCLNMYKPVK